MNVSTVVLLNLFCLIVVLAFVIYLFLKTKNLEDKTLDVSARDIVAFVEQMREMVIESEHIAENLDASIKEREAVLEDLSALVENRIMQLELLNLNTQQEQYEYQTEKEFEDRAALESAITEKLLEYETIEAKLTKEKKELEERLEKERLAYNKLAQENIILKQSVTPVVRPMQKIPRPQIAPATSEPIIPAQPTIVAQPIIKSTEEVLRTRTEPILIKQVEDRIPIDQASILRSRTGDIVKNKTFLNEDVQAEIHKLLLSGYSEEQIASKLGINLIDVENYTSLNN